MKSEIKQLTDETEFTTCTTDELHLNDATTCSMFESQRLQFYNIIDEWKTDRIEHISFIYQKKKNQIDLICSQTCHEYEIFRIEQKHLTNENLRHSTRIVPPTFLPNEIEQLNEKLSLTRHLLDYFIQPQTNHRRSVSDDDDDDDDDDELDNVDQVSNFSSNYEQIFRRKPIKEYSLLTDNLAMACSSSHLLLRDGPRLILFDEKEEIHQMEIKIQHPGDFIRDLCWCETLGYYLVLTQYLLFTYDPQRFLLNVIDKVKPIDRLKFSSLTCSENIMFLVNGNGQYIERWLIGKNFHWKMIKRN